MKASSKDKDCCKPSQKPSKSVPPFKAKRGIPPPKKGK